MRVHSKLDADIVCKHVYKHFESSKYLKALLLKNTAIKKSDHAVVVMITFFFSGIYSH